MPPEESKLLSVTELAYLSGINVRILRRLITLELIEPATAAPEPYFSVEVVHTVRRIKKLHVQLGVGWSSMGVVLELLNQIDNLESQLREELESPDDPKDF